MCSEDYYDVCNSRYTPGVPITLYAGFIKSSALFGLPAAWSRGRIQSRDDNNNNNSDTNKSGPRQQSRTYRRFRGSVTLVGLRFAADRVRCVTCARAWTRVGTEYGEPDHVLDRGHGIGHPASVIALVRQLYVFDGHRAAVLVRIGHGYWWRGQRVQRPAVFQPPDAQWSVAFG